jgi:hypothetical protein
MSIFAASTTNKIDLNVVRGYGWRVVTKNISKT